MYSIKTANEAKLITQCTIVAVFITWAGFMVACAPVPATIPLVISTTSIQSHTPVQSTVAPTPTPIVKSSATVEITNTPIPPSPTPTPNPMCFAKENGWRMNSKDDWADNVFFPSSKEPGISIAPEESEEGTWGIYYAWKQWPKDEQLTLTFRINQIDSTAYCGEPGDGADDYDSGRCVVNFIIGVGDPASEINKTNVGRFIMYRKYAKGDNDVKICPMRGVFGNINNCDSTNRLDPVKFSYSHELDLDHEIVFTFKKDLNLDATKLDVALDGNPVYKDVIISQYKTKLWIGYHFRSSGKLDAFVSCPIISAVK